MEVSSRTNEKKTRNREGTAGKKKKKKAPPPPSSDLAARMNLYQKNAGVAVNRDKVDSIKRERRRHVVTQSKVQREQSAAIMEKNVEMKKANQFDAVMERLGVVSRPSSSSSARSSDVESCGESGDTKPVTTTLQVDSNVLCLNNTLPFERLDPAKHSDKALKKLHGQYEQFIKQVATADKIDTVEMANCHLTDKFAELVAEHWLTCDHIVCINLESNLFTEEGLVALAGAVASNATLKTLLLRHQNSRSVISTPAAEAWCEALQQNKTLLKCGVDSALQTHTDVIRRCLDRNAEIRRKQRRQRAPPQQLDSAERRRIRAVAANDATGATGHGSKPDVFVFPDAEKRSYRSLKSQEKAELGKALAHNTVFKTIDLQSLDLDDAFGMALAESLRTNCTVTCVDLSNNRLTSKTVDALAAVLAEDNRTLRELKLLNQTPASGIKRASEAALARAVAANPVVTKIALSKWTDALARDQVDKKLMQNKWSKKK
jgi:hypothetical protein